MHKFFRQPFITGRGRGRSSAAGRGRTARQTQPQKGSGQALPSLSADRAGTQTQQRTSVAAHADFSDGDDNELAPELEAILDVADVYGKSTPMNPLYL